MFYLAEKAGPGLFEAAARPDALFERASAILKDSRSSKVALSSIPGLGDVFVKRHNSKSLRYMLRYLFREARAFRVWRFSWLLKQLEVPTPRPLAAIAFRSCGLALKSSYLVTERIEGLAGAMDYVPALLEKPGALDEFLAEAFLHLVKMHDCGLSHGDLKSSNLAAVEKAAGGGFAFAGFIDLDSMKSSGGPLSEKTRDLELARLAASLLDIDSKRARLLTPRGICERVASLYSAAGGAADANEVEKAVEKWKK